ncbi:MAG TPA: energy transducer TonB, partial [Bacteroidia bacterium]|nr:energy transducer TonB [Bacteroidia bacterium]
MKKIHSYFLFCCLLSCGTIIAQNKEKADTAYNMVDQMPTFQGDLDTYFRDHLHYTQAAFDKNIEGTAYLSFIVSTTGEIKDVKIEKGVSTDLDSVAIAVISNMPKWSPGKQNGKEVNVRCHLPVKFSVDKIGIGPKRIYANQRNFCDLKGFYVIPYFGAGIGSIPFNNGLPNLAPATEESGNTPYSFSYSFGSEFGYMFNNHSGLFVALQYQ